MDQSRKPAQQVGVYILPTSGHGSTCNYGDSPGTWDNNWNGSCRHMRWYSRLAWDEGGTAYDLKLDKVQNYQQLFLDFSTNTKYESNRHGYKFDLKSTKGTVLASKRYDVGGTVGRSVRGGQVLYLDFLDKSGSTRVGYSAGKLVPSAPPADPENNRLSISVLLDDNGVTQAEYRVLPREGAAEERSFWTQQANHAAKSNDIVSRTEGCIVADVCADPDRDDPGAGAFCLPVITGYTPYVTDVRFSLREHTADTRNNTVPIYAGDHVTLEADVSVPRLGDIEAEMKEVRFVILNKDGGVKDVYPTARRTSGDGQPLNTWYIDVPYTPTSDWDGKLSR